MIERCAVKVFMVLAAKFVVSKNDEEVVDTKYFNINVNRWFTADSRKSILMEMEEFAQLHSRWPLHSIIKLTVNTSRFNLMRGSS